MRACSAVGSTHAQANHRAASPDGRGAVALTADGDFVVLFGYEEDDEAPGPSPWHASVLQLGPDGGERWRTEIELLGSGFGSAMRVAPSGNLLVTGTFRERVSVGDLVLEDDSYPPRHFVAEIGPDGRRAGSTGSSSPRGSSAPSGSTR